MHPLVESLEHLKESELEQTIQSLTRKYWMASNMGIRNQISMLLETYNDELSNRRTKTWIKRQEEMDGDLSKLINIE